MPRPRTLAPALAVLLLSAFAPGAPAAKPQPPPPPPKIVAMVSGGPSFRAIASDGAVYDVGATHQVPLDACSDAITSVVLVGRLFPSAPVSPIAAVMYANNGLTATLENGDVWFFYESCCVSCYRNGYYMGNIFTVAGTAARTPDFSMQGFAPPVTGAPAAAEDDTPAAVRPGAEK